MGAVQFLGTAPNVHVSGTAFAAPQIHAWIARVKSEGGYFLQSRTTPFVQDLPSSGDIGEAPTVISASRWDPSDSVGSETVYIWAMRAGVDWYSIGGNMAGSQGDSTMIPLIVPDGREYSGLFISNGVLGVFSLWERGYGKFWRDFARAGVVVVGLAVAVSYAASFIPTSGPIPSVPAEVFVGPGIPAPTIEVANLAPLSQTVAPVAQTVAPTAGGFTLADVGAAIKTSVTGVQTAAQAIVQTAGAVQVVQAAIDGKPNPGQPAQYGPPDPPAEKPANNSALLLVGLVAIGFLV